MDQFQSCPLFLLAFSVVFDNRGAYTALKDSRFAINPTFMKFVMLRSQTVLEKVFIQLHVHF